MIRKLIHFSDTHEAAACLEDWRACLDKRIVGFFNSRVIRRSRYDRTLIEPALERMLAEKPDAIFFTGDAVSCGQPGEFARALPFFQVILDSGIPFFYTPGNHDAYVRDPACRDAFRRFTLAMTRGGAEPEDYPYAVDLEYFRVILLNCACPTSPVSSCGHLPEKAKTFLKKEAERFKTKPLICAGHFPILERMPLRRFRHRLYGAGIAAAMIRDGVIDLSLCGHVHKPYEILNASGRGEVSAGSLTKYGVYSRILYDTESGVFTLERVPVRNTAA